RATFVYDALYAWCRQQVGDARSCARSDLLAAPRVKGVVDEGRAFEEAMVVGFDVEATHADREEARSGGIAVEIAGDVRRMHDVGQPHEGQIPREVVLVDDDLEGALSVAMV